MEEYPQQPSNELPTSAPSVDFDPSQIYPTTQQEQTHQPTIDIKPVKASHLPPKGVMVISFFIIVFSGLGLWRALGNSSSFSVIIYSLQLLLGIGLLTMHEMARKIYVVLTIISLVLEIPGIIFVSSIQTSQGIFLIIPWMVVLIQFMVLLYLTRPSIKDKFS